MSLIKVEHITFSYPESLTPVFKDVSFKLDTNWRLGLIGRNGRGKTTLLRLFLGGAALQRHHLKLHKFRLFFTNTCRFDAAGAGRAGRALSPCGGLAAAA